ncbi:MAG: ABC transporter permease [Clostridia bacterium]|nr:ABC transporter permease [Clostridia bacterium]
MNKTKHFFKLIKYEFKRVARNKFVMSMLLCFSIVILLLLSFVNAKSNSYPIAVFLDGQNIEEVGVIDMLYENMEGSKIVYVDSREEGLEKLRENDVCFFIALNSDTDPVTATFYYDGGSAVGRTIKNGLLEKKGEYTYQVTSEFLKEYGITVNEAYFNTISFETSTKDEITAHQVPFGIEVASCVSIILMFGLAYSISRDNETKVSKNIAYMPLGTHKYLWAKIIPYFTLGMLEMIIVYAMGGLFFKIDYQVNPLIIFLLSSFFVMATIMLGLLFSCCKSQIATLFLCMGVIVVPIFAVTMIFIQTSILPFRRLLYCMPISVFAGFLNGMMFSGVIMWWSILAFVIQIIVYYILTVYIINKRVAKCKF